MIRAHCTHLYEHELAIKVIYALATLTAFVSLTGQLPLFEPFWIYFGGYDPVHTGNAIDALPDFFFNPGALESEALSNARFFLVLYVVLPVVLIGVPTILMGMSFPKNLSLP